MTKLALGYHLILDLNDCKEGLTIVNPKTEHWPWTFIHTPREIIEIKEQIKVQGLNCVSFSEHVFENGSWSACYVLSESHLSIHTWPEIGYVSADIFVCNFTADNRNKADRLSEFLIDYFKAGKINVQRIERS